MNENNRRWGLMIWRVGTLLAIAILTAGGLSEVSSRQDSITRSNRWFCDDAERRSKDLKTFLNGVLREPRAEDFAFINDPVLREGAFNAAKARYAENKKQLDGFGQPRDCVALFPLEDK